MAIIEIVRRQEDITGLVPDELATDQYPSNTPVGGDIIRLNADGTSWNLRVDCQMSPASCPVITQDHPLGRRCKARNMTPNQSVLHTVVWCGKTPSARDDLSQASAQTSIPERPTLPE